MILPDNFKPKPTKFPELSKRIRDARKAKRITQSEMAVLIGVDWVTYSKIDSGHILPDDDTLKEINRVLFS